MSTTLPLPVPVNHPAYAGHFPGRPILPGVVLLDLAQTAIEKATGLRFTGLDAAKFLSPVQPGETLELEFDATDNSARFDIRCGQRRIASGRFSAAT